jgi:hypothetical protein
MLGDLPPLAHVSLWRNAEAQGQLHLYLRNITANNVLSMDMNKGTD